MGKSIMGQFWMWHYSVANAMASVLLSGVSQVALGMLDLGVYPDVRLARLRDKQVEQNQ